MTPRGRFGRLHSMSPISHPLRFLLVALAGWINQQQREVIDYLHTENRVLREQLGTRRLRFTDAQRRRLAAKAKTLGRHVLADLVTIVTPDTVARMAPDPDRQTVRRQSSSRSRATTRRRRDPRVDYPDG